MFGFSQVSGVWKKRSYGHSDTQHLAQHRFALGWDCTWKRIVLGQKVSAQLAFGEPAVGFSKEETRLEWLTSFPP